MRAPRYNNVTRHNTNVTISTFPRRLSHSSRPFAMLHALHRRPTLLPRSQSSCCIQYDRANTPHGLPYYVVQGSSNDVSGSILGIPSSFPLSEILHSHTRSLPRGPYILSGGDLSPHSNLSAVAWLLVAFIEDLTCTGCSSLPFVLYSTFSFDSCIYDVLYQSPAKTGLISHLLFFVRRLYRGHLLRI